MGMSTMSRRTFAKGAVAGAASLAAASVSAAGPALADEAPVEATQTIECDIAVAGLGGSGLLAAYTAGMAGANVVAVDTAGGMMGTANIFTVVAFVANSKLQEASAEPLTVKEYIDYANADGGYQHNQRALYAITQASGRAIDILTDHGIVFFNNFAESGSFMPVPPRALVTWGVSGMDRALIYEAMLEEAGVKTMFETTAETLIFDEEGNVAGMRCTQGDGVIDIYAKAVILATGGFMNDPERVKKCFGGEFVCEGVLQNTGLGITMAESAGAQMGKNFSISINEYGGANPKASYAYAFRPNMGSNEAMRLTLFGGLMVNVEGKRFCDEGIIHDDVVNNNEILLRDWKHYAICDEAFMRRWESEPLPTFLGTECMKGLFEGFVCEDIREQFQQGIDEGWAYKADTIEELAEYYNLPNLAETVAAYNGYAQTGEDTEFFKRAELLYPVTEAPFYIFESVVSGGPTTGGIKCNEKMQALDFENRPIAGLYVCGCNADIFATPETTGMNGACMGSGVVAGEAAAASL